MATASRIPGVPRAPVKAKPRPETDREALRAEIAARYENTLRYLGK